MEANATKLAIETDHTVNIQPRRMLRPSYHTHISKCAHVYNLIRPKNNVCHFYFLKQRTLKRQERVRLGP